MMSHINMFGFSSNVLFYHFTTNIFADKASFYAWLSFDVYDGFNCIECG